MPDPRLDSLNSGDFMQSTATGTQQNPSKEEVYAVKTEKKLIRVAVLGASGYSGSELVSLLHNNAYFDVVAAYASGQSSPQTFQTIAPALAGGSDLIIQPWNPSELDRLHDIDAVFFALPHETSAELAAVFIQRGIKVFDLSGAFRFHSKDAFKNAYGFDHPHPELLDQAQYALMEWTKLDPQGMLFAIPGCYPTAASLALKPACESALLEPGNRPVITAVSGVSGAGRGANPRTSFCEVSLQAYGVLNHRHTPEIAANLGRDVVFTPVLGPYKRGILATCVGELQDGVSEEQVKAIYRQAYQHTPLVQLRETSVAVDHVAHTPMCLLNVHVKDRTLVVVSVIDNLLKGAAAQAMQAANVVFGKPETAGLGGAFQ